MSMQKVLLVDDEQNLVALLQEWLEDDGYDVCATTSPRDALRLLFEYRPALSVVDLRMPGMDGFQLISRIREICDVRVLVYSALSGEQRMIRGLELGADEYLVKPVSRELFLARIKSLMRRPIQSEEEDTVEEYADSNLTLDFRTQEVRVQGQNLYLRPTEFKLLAFLVRNCDRVVGHQELLDRVWGDAGGSLDSLKWYIASLRSKVGNPGNPRFILTIPRVGYRYCPQGQVQPQLAVQPVRGAPLPDYGVPQPVTA